MKMSNRGREGMRVIWGYSWWMSKGWILCLGLIWIPSFGESFLVDVEQNFAIPEVNINWNKTNAKSNCICKNMCCVKPSCKAVTIFNDENGLRCGFTEDDLKSAHLIPNVKAITLFPTKPGQPSCSAPYRRCPGVGCVRYVHKSCSHWTAKSDCENDEANLFVAENPQHLQRLVENFLINIEGASTVWMGISRDSWFDGRSVMPEEWDVGNPDPTAYNCAFLNMETRRLRDTKCVPNQTGFVCEKKQ